MLSLKMTFAILTLAAVSFSFYKKTVSLSWQSSYKKNLTLFYDTLKDNHPGFYDDQNPDFKLWLNKGYKEALAKVEEVHSYQDYKKNLCCFADGF